MRERPLSLPLRAEHDTNPAPRRRSRAALRKGEDTSALLDELAELRARDHAFAVELSGATSDITTELGKTEFKDQVLSYKKRM